MDYNQIFLTAYCVDMHKYDNPSASFDVRVICRSAQAEGIPYPEKRLRSVSLCQLSLHCHGTFSSHSQKALTLFWHAYRRWITGH